MRPFPASIRFLKRLASARSGVALTEFALSLPLLFAAGLYGVETAYQTAVQMQISQLAVQVADNASRIGDTSTLRNRKIYESDVNDVFAGANIQADNLDLFQHGRVILSSLEVVPDTDDQQYIHWQRCKGTKEVKSSYGLEGDGRTGAGLVGMGPDGEEVMAFKNEAVMFVEIQYDYQPLIGDFIPHRKTMSAIASFNVRDSRDLSQIYQRDGSTPDTVADCKVYNGVGSPKPET